jgi:glyoxylase-like metal-dependent hydrolase (beta-lactamase superfamily II)
MYHSQAANKVKRKSGAKIYSHWIEARYLGQNPPYLGPPSAQETVEKLEKLGVSMRALIKEYGSFEVEPISVDEQVSDGDMIGSLKVIHTPGHTPGHISLYYEKDKLLLGADNFDKLLMAHQDSPLLEGTGGAVEKLVAESIQKLKR